MLDAALEAQGFAADRARNDLDRDRQLVLALVKCIEIVGEAASQTTPATRSLLPNIPWPSIVAMRHRLVHAYFDIDHDRVWDTIVTELPPLVAALQAGLAGH
jgi:uncharacterized protein with HEPN domain